MTMNPRPWTDGLLLAVALLAVALAAPLAAAAEPLSATQNEQIEQLVRDYILKNPEVVVESLRAYEGRQQQAAEKLAQQAVAANRQALQNDSTSPVAGNPKGDVTIVEFFDYRCGYCKKVLPSVRELLESDGNVRMIFKELPILGPDSVTAAQMALAAWKLAPDKYLAYHSALMEARGELNEARLLEIAKTIGIDQEKLKAASASPGIKATIDKNVALARTLQIGGTPAFVVGDQLVPGAVDLDTLRDMVKAARSG